jgi:hypothetical protein
MTEHEPSTWWKENETTKYSDKKGAIHDAPSEFWREGKQMYHLCPDGQVYFWQTRKTNPKSCPRCRYRFDSPYRKRI